MLRTVGLGLCASGVVTFFATPLLSFTGHAFDRIELPAFYETTTLALPDGGRLTATQPLQRVQHYDRDGRFENGWFVPAKGGRFAIGLAEDGRVAVCTARGRRIYLFDLEGRSSGEQDCFGAPREVPAILQPADFDPAALKLLPASAITSPAPSLSGLLLVPLWHPFVAWFMAGVGYLIMKSSAAASRT